MIPSLSIGPRALLNDCNHSATAIFWRSAISRTYRSIQATEIADKYIADPRILYWWTEPDLRTDSLHQSDAPLGLPWCS